MKKYFLLLVLIPLSTNGALSLFSLKNFGNVVRTLSQQKASLSSSPAPRIPVKHLSQEERLAIIVFQDLAAQGIKLTDIDPCRKEALRRCIKGLINTAVEYKKNGYVTVYDEWQMLDSTLEAVVECLRDLEE
jgi:hypothetical protein